MKCICISGEYFLLFEMLIGQIIFLLTLTVKVFLKYLFLQFFSFGLFDVSITESDADVSH